MPLVTLREPSTFLSVIFTHHQTSGVLNSTWHAARAPSPPAPWRMVWIRHLCCPSNGETSLEDLAMCRMLPARWLMLSAPVLAKKKIPTAAQTVWWGHHEDCDNPGKVGSWWVTAQHETSNALQFSSFNPSILYLPGMELGEENGVMPGAGWHIWVTENKQVFWNQRSTPFRRSKCALFEMTS